MDNDIYNETCSNVVHETSDVRIQPFPESICSPRPIPDTQSPYETLDVLTQVVRSHQLNCYEELATIHLQPDTDISQQLITTQTQDSQFNDSSQIDLLDGVRPNCRPRSNPITRPPLLNDTSSKPKSHGVVSPPRPPVYLDLVNDTQLYEPYAISTCHVVTNSAEEVSTDLEVIPKVNCNEQDFLKVSPVTPVSKSRLVRRDVVITTSTLLLREYDYINEYCDIPLSHEGEQCGPVHNPTSRPFPDTSLGIYESLNKATRLSNTNAKNTVSLGIPNLIIAKIFLILTGLVALVVVTVVINTAVLNMINNRNVGKLFAHKNLLLISMTLTGVYLWR